jgi:sarcosine oxidase gamma subunit
MIASKLAAMGLWPQAFSDMVTIAASGTTLATAAVCALADVVKINGGTGSIAFTQPGTPGDTMTLVNATAAAVTAYPVVPGGMINGSANPFSVGINHASTLRCLAPGQWFVTNDVALTGAVPLTSVVEPAAAG